MPGIPLGAKSFLLFTFTSALLVAQEKQTSIADCTFKADPESYLTRGPRIRNEISDRARKVSRALAGVRYSTGATVDPAAIPRRSFIDDEIFDRLATSNVPSAPLATDEEFLRRVSLDLTGRLPKPEDIRSFVDDTDTGKRDSAIDRLINTPEFRERWAMWMGDLLQITATASNVNRQIDGRNAFYLWTWRAIGFNKPLREIAWNAVSAVGNSFDADTGATNFAVNATTPMGPAQDVYDTMLVRTATTFMGLGHYDCLLCHDGRRHLDEVSLWGKSMTRLDAEKMASFFSRLRLNGNGARAGSRDVVDATAGQYDLNTTSGNRPNRQPIGTVRSLTPEYRNGNAASADLPWRQAFANNMIDDPMFARNFANRIWKYFFTLGLVDPVDTLDPARLDPANPPPAPWTLQATHPQLLERLARALTDRDYNLREFIRLIVSSSAYQLSSRYDGEWKLDYVPLFARHYPRRLEGEEIHDEIIMALATPVTYTLQGLDPVNWAVQLPEPAEPRSNGAAANFMNVFLRGNRDTVTRSQSGSILQQLSLMNDNFVLSRVRKAASPALQAISAIPGNEDAVDELFLRFMARRPTDAEKSRAVQYLAKYSASRDAAIEDLAWVCINKIDFLYSY